jgi:hypothetical protein
MGQEPQICDVIAMSAFAPSADITMGIAKRRSGPILLKNSPVETVKAR